MRHVIAYLIGSIIYSILLYCAENDILSTTLRLAVCDWLFVVDLIVIVHMIYAIVALRPLRHKVSVITLSMMSLILLIYTAGRFNPF